MSPKLKGNFGKRVRGISIARAATIAALLSSAATAADPQIVQLSDGCASLAGAVDENGKWRLADGSPVFRVCKRDGVVVADWHTYSGFRRYHSECGTCHGDNGLGTSRGPALADSLKRLTYEDFHGIVANGRTREEAGTKVVMPAFGDNKNVMCFIDDLYVYLKARAVGALPAASLGAVNRDKKPEAAREHEKSCLGS